jgi:hypothetical protein
MDASAAGQGQYGPSSGDGEKAAELMFASLCEAFSEIPKRSEGSLRQRDHFIGIRTSFSNSTLQS